MEPAVLFLTTIDYEKRNILQSNFSVFDENGEYVFILCRSIGELSTTTGGPYLRGCASGEFISLASTEEEVEEFISWEYRLREKLRTLYTYVSENLDEEEYGGCYHNGYEYEEDSYEVVHILLVNEKRQEELEKMGFKCHETSYSLKDKYEDWEQQSSEKNMESPAEFVQELQSGWHALNDSFEDGYFEKLEKAISDFQNQYPEYSCKNIYYHIAGDCNPEQYFNFDAEVIAFVDSLPNYEADREVDVEEEFGDRRDWN